MIDLRVGSRSPVLTVVGWVETTDGKPWQSVGCAHLRNQVRPSRNRLSAPPAVFAQSSTKKQFCLTWRRSPHNLHESSPFFPGSRVSAPGLDCVWPPCPMAGSRFEELVPLVAGPRWHGPSQHRDLDSGHGPSSPARPPCPATRDRVSSDPVASVRRPNPIGSLIRNVPP
jgi:hypothetical protein